MARLNSDMNPWDKRQTKMPLPRVAVQMNGRKHGNLDLWAGKAGQPPLKALQGVGNMKPKAQPKQMGGRILSNADVWK